MLVRIRVSATVVLAVAAAAACSDRPDVPTPVQPRAASVTSVSVTSTSPAWGDQGQISEQVTIKGSGFSPGANAAWALNGVVSSDVQVVSTQYVSSKQLVATVNIASGATLALYDVQVTNTTGTKGIGNDLFEVTQAFTITGMANAYGTNNYGQVVGKLLSSKAITPGDPALWTPATALGRTGTITHLGTVANAPGATAEAIDEAGTVIVGEGGPAYYWLKTASGWTSVQQLPHDPSTTVGYARALASDPITGVARWIGGQENVSSLPQPRMWHYDATSQTFTRYVMPFPAGSVGGRIRGINASAQGVGAAPLANGDQAAAYWDQTGAAILLPPGGNTSAAYAITSDGSTIVGVSGGVAVFWTNTGGNSAGTFSGPYVLPGTCSAAVDVDDAGHIIGNGCQNNGRNSSAAWVTPFTSVIYLPGLGDKFDAGTASSISLSGHSIAGSAGGAAIWQIF